MTEEEIIKALRNNDRVAERQFYQQNRTKCIQYAVKKFFWKTKEGKSIKCSDEDGEELYNDACVLFVQNVLRNRIGHLEVKISTYLITSMRYLWLNKAKSKYAKAQTSLVNLPESSSTTGESIKLKVRKAINQLDDKCKEMMTYRYILGWEDYEDIAKATGKNNGDVVRNLISRCRKRFRDIYAQVTNLSDV